MKHLGNITQISGYEVPVVDCMIGGSPCQGLSLAGKRAGFDDERSVLYMEQIRVTKEMREADARRGNSAVDIRPRYMVWENVAGAFSTNDGKDFAAVLTEAIRVVEPEAPSVDVPKKGWPTSGCLYDEMGKWSVAWRVLDAQFWGTPSKPLPQRRRRIALVADFGGLSASKILFVTTGVSGDIEPGREKRQEAAGDVGYRPEGTGKAIGFPLGFRPENTRVYDETATTLCNGTRPGFTTGVIQATEEKYLFENHAMAARYKGPLDVAPTISEKLGTGGNNAPLVIEPSGEYWDGTQTTGTLTANNAAGRQRMPDKENFNCVIQQQVGTFQETGIGWWNESSVGATLRALSGSDALKANLVVAGVDGYNATEYEEISGTLRASAAQNIDSNNAVRHGRVVRRLTPLECERLQGFPDGWTDIGDWVDSKGRRHKAADAPRYRALGNSIALPPWKWVLKRICACYERDATMASLFDGIGGFPLLWEQLNGKGSCLWASEIEEFPMAVTKIRLGGNDNENYA